MRTDIFSLINSTELYHGIERLSVSATGTAYVIYILKEFLTVVIEALAYSPTGGAVNVAAVNFLLTAMDKLNYELAAVDRLEYELRVEKVGG